MRIFKLSLGTQYITNREYRILRENNLVCVAPGTLPKGQSAISQGELYLTAERGDLFYVCRSNDSIEFIGMFIDERPLYSILQHKQDWVDREYILIADAINPAAYDQNLDHWWTPKNNSTFIEIDTRHYDEFEQEFLSPVFDKTMAQIRDIRDQEFDSVQFDMQKCVDLRNTFLRLSSDETFLLETINDLGPIELKKLAYEYESRGNVEDQPVVYLRSLILNELIEKKKVTVDRVNALKREIGAGFEKNVFHVWKSPFRILYTFYYAKWKPLLEGYLNALVTEIQEELDIVAHTKVKIVHFDGAQNQGTDRLWFAIYNKSFKTQQLAKQLFFHLIDGFEFGLHDKPNPANNKLIKTQVFDKQALIDKFREHKQEILTDNSMEKVKIAEYIDILEYKKQIILQGPPGTGKTYMARKMARQLIPDLNNKQFELVQFHPSYTYEDFVRGIVAESTSSGKVNYETKNKILADFAERAQNNLLEQDQPPAILTKREWLRDQMIGFIDTIQLSLEKNDNEHPVHGNAFITEIIPGAFRYTGRKKNGERWDSSARNMKFEDIIQGYLEEVKDRGAYKALDSISGLAKQHASYFYPMVVQFSDYLKKLDVPEFKEYVTPERKDYVLIIDEINRANLPTVLGELIYALEYRNETVSSLYAIDDDSSIVIPENLYIIGTMNTADRSVGHIDYAIKRRFAFVDVLPNMEVIKNEKAKALFKSVAELFVVEKEDKKEKSEFLAGDFDYKDVQLGHSYFILDEGTEEEQLAELKLKLDYEIKPILREYVKDGLLLETAIPKIESLDI